MAEIQNRRALSCHCWQFHDIKASTLHQKDYHSVSLSSSTACFERGYLLGSQRPYGSTVAALSGCLHTISEWHLGDQFLPFSQSGVNRAYQTSQLFKAEPSEPYAHSQEFQPVYAYGLSGCSVTVWFRVYFSLLCSSSAQCTSRRKRLQQVKEQDIKGLKSMAYQQQPIHENSLRSPSLLSPTSGTTAGNNNLTLIKHVS